ncbi:MAG: YHS domain-containing protein [Bryobacteraceae bacterium]
MVRLVLYLLLAVILITLLRSVIGVLLRAAAHWLVSGGSAPSRPPQMGGELRQDPVCGVYIPTATPFKLNEGGKVLYFCSEACREKYRRGERAGKA